jgi:hypothetical protein
MKRKNSHPVKPIKPLCCGQDIYPEQTNVVQVKFRANFNKSKADSIKKPKRSSLSFFESNFGY